MFINIHKLEDGDIIKILPMIDENDNISWIKSYDCVSTQALGSGGLTVGHLSLILVKRDI
jgi:hypothetical protein